MKTCIVVASLLPLFARLDAIAAGSELPRLPVAIICYNGKLDSGSSCTSRSANPETKGKLTCGFPGKVAEISWTFVERRDGKDLYSFTRRFPLKAPETATETKQVEFAGERVIVFEDKFQVVVIQRAQAAPIR